MAEGEEVIRIRRTRSDNNVLLTYVKNYLRPEIGERIEKEDLLSQPMLHVLRHKLGLPLRTGVQYLMAVIADYEIASALSVSISSPVLYSRPSSLRRENCLRLIDFTGRTSSSIRSSSIWTKLRWLKRAKRETSERLGPAHLPGDL